MEEPLEATEPQHGKPMLTVEEQIAHLKEKGVKFELCSENDAAAYLTEKCNFFRATAYRKLFDKHVGGDKDGQYVDLDFAQLRFLADLDRQLRDVLLPMSLDVEHFAKVALLDRLSRREEEDGYEVVSEYRTFMRKSGKTHVESELRARASDAYCRELIGKYGDDMPAWVLLEMVSFGTLIALMKFCADRWSDEYLLGLHYQLKYVKSVRNASGHSSCILNDLRDANTGNIRISSAIAKVIAQMGVPKKRRARKLRNERMQQIATLLYLYAELVPAGKSKERAVASLSALLDTVEENATLLPKANPARSSLDFVKTLTVGFGVLD